MKFIVGAIGHLVAAMLLALGTWLASRVPEDNALQYTIRTTHVGSLSTWYVRLDNQTKNAFDLEFKQPGEPLLGISFDPSSSTPGFWKGQLLVGQSLQVIAVVQHSEVEPNVAWLSNLVTARYQERDDTGVMRSRDAPLREASVLPISRTVRQVVWFLLPILVMGAILLILYWRKRRSRKPAAPPARAADGDMKVET